MSALSKRIRRNAGAGNSPRRKARIVRTQMSDRGLYGVGGGRAAVVQAPREYRATTVQACGLWPFVTGASAPMIGVPAGLVLTDGQPFCCDPISWFQIARLISNPSGFVLGLPGLGKSTLMRRMVLGAAGFGQIPLILGDLKPDYVDLVEALDGQVIRLGLGRGYWNVLDIEDDVRAAERLRTRGYVQEAAEVMADARGSRAVLLEGLIEIARQAALNEREKHVLAAALEVLDRRSESPVVPDVLKLIEDRAPELAEAALDRGDTERYRDVTENLRVSLRGLMGAGGLGEIFSRPTSVRLRPDRPAVFDISSVEGNNLSLQAAVLLTCWTAGFQMIRRQQILGECGVEPVMHYLAVTDELWRPLRVGDFMVERIDTNTRLNRTLGVGTLSCTHTMKDLEALQTERAREIARGFVERAGFVICGGLPRREIDVRVNEKAALPSILPMSEAEVQMVAGWSSPAAHTRGVAAAEPPGRGHFLAKIGGRPGIPFRTVLTNSELAVNDTNKLWHETSRLEQIKEASA